MKRKANIFSKALTFFLIIISFLSLIGCNSVPEIQNNDDKKDTQIEQPSDKQEDKKLSLKINNTLVEVFWAENESVNALKALAKDGLTVDMHMYSTFEQVGPLGTSLPSNDANITTTAGDICLYSSNQIVIFYGTNTWAYTKLGHINLSKTELVELLGDEDVVITITLN